MTLRKARILWLTAALLFMAALIFFITRKKSLDSDELESLYASWLIAKGQLPYRDFYQIHTPLFYYFFAPIFLFYRTLEVISAARFVVFILLFLNGFLLFKISERLFNTKIGISSLFFYLTSLHILSKMTEIRPDVFVAIFSNLSLAFLLCTKRNIARAFFLAGTCCALAVLSRQSGMIFLIALIVFFILRIVSKNSSFWNNSIFLNERFNTKTLLFFLSGFLVVVTLFVLFLYANNAAEPFLKYSVNNDFLRNFLFLETESHRFSPFGSIKDSFSINPSIYVFVLISLFIFGRKPKDQRTGGSYIFVFILASVCFLALFLVLKPWPQEMILPSQYLSILAGFALVKIFENIYSIELRRGEKFFYLSAIVISISISLFTLPGNIKKFLKGKTFLDEYTKGFNKIISLTNKDDKCISLVFPCLFRPSAYFYRIGSSVLESVSSKRSIENMLVSDIMQGDIKIIVPSDDLNLIWGFVQVVKEHYIMHDSGFYVPGGIIDLAESEPKNLNILVPGWYQIESNIAEILLDGQRLVNKSVYLKSGRHTICSRNGTSIFRFSYDFQANRKTR